ncbi:MAG: hypothetical protein JSV21_06890, partial [Nitrospirota bacterium]
MRISRIVLIVLSIAVLVSASFMLSACGGGGGGGGPSVDNSKLFGTYLFIYIQGDAVSQQGTMDFLGNGTANLSVIAPVCPGCPSSVGYTAYSDNTILINNELAGTLRSDGSFFVGNSIIPGAEAMVMGIKQSAVSEPSTVYRGGQIMHDGTNSDAWIVELTTSSPGAGQLDFIQLEPCQSINPATCVFGPQSYQYFPSTGYINNYFPDYFQHGNVSSDQKLIIVGDSGTHLNSPGMLLFLGLEKPSAA